MDTMTATWSFLPFVESEECTVCLETKEVTAFPDSPLTRACKHTPSTCLDCIRLSISCDIDAKLWSEVGCPECESLLPPEAVQRYADDESWQRYNDLCILKALEEDKEFVWCAAGCGSGQIHDGGHMQPIAKCTSCGRRTCFQHKVLWHAGLTCDEWDLLQTNPSQDGTDSVLQLERSREIKASEETIKQIAKPCPGCARSIEKNGGCSHMTCFSCAHQFCWLCGGPWDGHGSCNSGYYLPVQ